MSEPRTIIDVLDGHAERQPHAVAFTFLPGGADVARDVTYGELRQRARAIAAFLQSHDLAGERVLILQPSGIEYIAAFLGCVYAGAIAVPAYPSQSHRRCTQIGHLAADSEAAAALVESHSRPSKESLEFFPALAQLLWLDTAQVPGELASRWRHPSVVPESLCYLQYTSGSTAAPKGVMITHQNVLSCERMIRDAFGQTQESIIVSWLPLHHDMGLIGSTLQSLYLGARCIQMAPATFLRRPLTWLDAISQYRATTSGGPNFAYDLCAQRISEPQKQTLDLSAWRVAFNGSEKVRSSTIERFAEAFRTCGFGKQSFHPCYGLAEATLLVTSAAGIADDPVSCGSAPEGVRVEIVDAEAKSVCAQGTAGEIWVRGPNVASGYWKQPEQTAERFHARIRGEESPLFLRTGDLGVMRGGRLWITGRLKDLIIIRGRNHHPEDIEATIAGCHPAACVHTSAAFGHEADAGEQLVIVQEIETKITGDDLQTIAETIRSAVVREHGIDPRRLVFVRANSIDRTTSGKVRRGSVKERYLCDKLATIRTYEWPVAELPEWAGVPLLPGSEDLNSQGIELYLSSRLAQFIPGKRFSAEDASRPFLQAGLDSVSLVQLVGSIEEDFGIRLDVMETLQGGSVATLAREIASRAAAGRFATPKAVTRSADLREFPLSHGQKAFWYVEQLIQDATPYLLARAFRVHGDADPTILAYSVRRLIERHRSLRTTFAHGESGPYQVIGDVSPQAFVEVPSEGRSDLEVLRAAREEARRPMALAAGPLFRVVYFHNAQSEPILLVLAHHIVCDLRSFSLILRELDSLYNIACGASHTAPLPDTTYDFPEFAEDQNRRMAGAEGAAHRTFWSNSLSQHAGRLQLPQGQPRPAAMSFRAASIDFNLSEPRASALKSLAARNSVSLYTLLLSIFETLLFRYSAQERFDIGSFASARMRAADNSVVGCLANALPITADCTGNPVLSAFLRRVGSHLAGVLEHQEYPFSLLVEELNPEREPGRSPIFDCVFSFFNTAPGAESLAEVALERPGGTLAVGPLRLECLPLARERSAYELILEMAVCGSGLGGRLVFSTAVFSREFAQRLVLHLQALIDHVIDQPETPLSELRILSAAEQLQIIGAWNATAVPHSSEASSIQECIELQARRTPDAPAIYADSTSINYAKLDEESTQLARLLLQQDVSAETAIGICLGRSLDVVIAIVGILKAGCAFLPIDPDLPQDRIRFMIADAGVQLVLTDAPQAERFSAFACKRLIMGAALLHQEEERAVSFPVVTPYSAAYIMYTSGSSGTPKGVVVTHGNVINFFDAMNRCIPVTEHDLVLATTSISFDISILELLWPLTRGIPIRLMRDQAVFRGSMLPKIAPSRPMPRLSLAYFAAEGASDNHDQYRLLLEGARYADAHGFEAVWTPERHFHAFGGLYPNPSVIACGLSAITKRIAIRAGSVVLPLHNPIRVAEEWALVDNISGGRIGISFASGWHADDFVLWPERYSERKAVLYQAIATVLRLWRGESIRARNGLGKEIEVRIFPAPVQHELPVWITAAGSTDTFKQAGLEGFSVLTHLLGQNVEKLKQNIAIYRSAQASERTASSAVTLMMHTFVSSTKGAAFDTVRKPLLRYLRTSTDLIDQMIRSVGAGAQAASMRESDLDDLIEYAFSKYFHANGLIGDCVQCLERLEEVRDAGVQEVACLIDFGVSTDLALQALERLAEVRRQATKEHPPNGRAAPVVLPTIAQFTPSLLRLLLLNSENDALLSRLRLLLVGGEAMTPALAQEAITRCGAQIRNMYGPTEATIWSTVGEVTAPEDALSIGRPIANTRAYVLGDGFELLPVGIAGELFLGGRGIARGYLGKPALTAGLFLPDPWSPVPGGRMYRTGDLARYRSDGTIEYLGRNDFQIKLRGHRIELQEIENVLGGHPDVLQNAVAMRGVTGGDQTLAAYVVSRQTAQKDTDALIRYLRQKLPHYMVPSSCLFVDALPMTANGKLDRKALHQLAGQEQTRRAAPPAAFATALEEKILAIWRELLGKQDIGAEDNFFDIGGHSLLMAQVHVRLRQELDRPDLPLIRLLEFPTVKALAAYFDRECEPRPEASTPERAAKQKSGLLRQRRLVSRVRA